MKFCKMYDLNDEHSKTSILHITNIFKESGQIPTKKAQREERNADCGVDLIPVVASGVMPGRQCAGNAHR